MIIKIVGKIDDGVLTLSENIKSGIVKLGLYADDIVVESDDAELKNYNANELPIVFIDDKIISTGSVLSVREVMDLLEQGGEKCCGCSCGCC